MKTVFIYALKDPRDGAVRYIGKTETPESRLHTHVREAKKRKKLTYKNNWIFSLLSNGVFPDMEILDEVPYTQQNFFERAYIKVYRESGFKLTNGTDGGDGGATTTGRKMPPEQRAKISAGNKGVPKSPESIAKNTGQKRSSETRARISASRVGKPLSEETCSRMSASKIGKKLSQEHRANMSAGMKGVKLGRPWTDIQWASFEKRKAENNV